MNSLISFSVYESGLQRTAFYSRRTVEKSFEQLAARIASRYAACNADLNGEKYTRAGKSRFIAGIAGPPGCGKSTIAAVLQKLLSEKGIETHILPLDGFHFKNEELKKRTIALGKSTVPLYMRKGAKESYDTGRFYLCMEKLKAGETFYWPVYSRALHDPVEEGILLSSDHALYIVEGNYLFLRQEPWKHLGGCFDLKIFILSRPFFLKSRLISRKHRGGHSRRDARRHYRQSDLLNIREVLRNSGSWDITLVQRGRYRYALRLG